MHDAYVPTLWVLLGRWTNVRLSFRIGAKWFILSVSVVPVGINQRNVNEECRGV